MDAALSAGSIDACVESGSARRFARCSCRQRKSRLVDWEVVKWELVDLKVGVFYEYAAITTPLKLRKYMDPPGASGLAIMVTCIPPPTYFIFTTF